MEAPEQAGMSEFRMKGDDDSVLRWEIADFLERWRKTGDWDFITSGLFVLKAEDGKETRFFVQLEKITHEGTSANSRVHFRCLDDATEWKNLLNDRPLWIEREDETKSAEKTIKLKWTGKLRSKFASLEELAEFEEDEPLTICVRFDPPAVVFPVQLQPLLSLSQHNVGYLPSTETYGEAFNWKQEVAVEKLGKFSLELEKESEEISDSYREDYEENPVVAKLSLLQLPSNAQEVIVKYDVWVMDTEDEDYEDEKKRTCIYGNIVSFTAVRKEATVEFEGGSFYEWGEGRLFLLIHGYRIVPTAPPPPRMDEMNLLTTRFAQLFNDPNYANVRVLVGDHVFHVSKEILAMHSTYFCAMFKHKWKEQETNEISIKDFEPEIVEAMLRFMYTGRVENLEENARFLFLAADKYNVDLLRDLTVDHMCTKVCLENVVEMLDFALEHPTLEKLREWALDFAARHYPQLHDRAEWKEFAAEHPPILQRLMEKILSHE